jgi:hypothetical protein
MSDSSARLQEEEEERARIEAVSNTLAKRPITVSKETCEKRRRRERSSRLLPSSFSLSMTSCNPPPRYKSVRRKTCR